jgi:2-dehydropantoate 2-reductase
MSIARNSRITVAGAGSIGCYVGGCLARAGRDVTLLTRPALADAMARHGLRISDLSGADHTIAPPSLRLATDADAALAEADVVLVTVKSGATAEIGDAIARHAPASAVVVSLQNGIGNADALRARGGAKQRVVAGMVPFNVVQTQAEGTARRFHRATSGTIRIASGVAGLRDLIDAPGAPVAEHDDMAAVLWAKLVLNLNNALNALSGLPLAVELADRRWRMLLAAQIAEALTVLRAADIRLARIEAVPPPAIPLILRLPDFFFRAVAGRMLAIDPAARSSMWEDLERRRPTEIDYLQGAILALARNAGIAVPLTERIAGLIKEAEAAGHGSPRLQPHQIGGA